MSFIGNMAPPHFCVRHYQRIRWIEALTWQYAVDLAPELSPRHTDRPTDVQHLDLAGADELVHRVAPWLRLSVVLSTKGELERETGLEPATISFEG